MRPGITALCCFITLNALITPISSNAISKVQPRQEVITLTGITFAEGKCSSKQEEIVRETLRALKPYALAAADIQAGEKTFQQFFGSGWLHSHKLNRFNRIKDNLRFAGNFPTNGNPKSENKFDRANQIAIRCDDVEKLCDGGSRGAYANNDPFGKFTGHIQWWYINLCPRFFDRYGQINDRVKKTPTKFLVSLVTREHILLHELLHCDVAGYTDHITDASTTVQGVKGRVYGSERCEALATEKNGPSFVASENADSYAWHATAKFFGDRWGIKMEARAGDNVPRDSKDDIDIYGPDQVKEYDPNYDGGDDDPPDAPPPAPSQKPNLNCNRDCCGFVPDPAWCNANCGGRTC